MESNIEEYEYEAGESITPEPAPTKEGFVFSGWSEIPEKMPAHDVTVTGSFVEIEMINGKCGINASFSYNPSNYTLIISGTGEVGHLELPTDPKYKNITKEIKKLIINEGITRIGESAFDEFNSINSISLPNGLLSLGIRAFAQCTGLQTIDLPNSITEIEDKAFTGCTSLSSINIPTAVTKISYGTFDNCPLTKVNIPKGVTVIGDRAFSFNNNLEEFSCIVLKVPPTGQYSFAKTNIENAILKVPARSLDKYKAAEPWKNFKEVVGVETNDYILTYKVEGEVYKEYILEAGETITPEPAPTKEGYTFSGWSEIPKKMPANDVTITGTFSINKYKLIYKVGDEIYKEYELEYGSTITPEPAPTKEGYTFSGWSEIPQTMPAKDVTVTGTFTINKYKLTYKVDGEVYKEYTIEFGATITPEPAPTKEGYTFSGWSTIPENMPAKDVTVTGTFKVNKYKLVYKVDGAEYKTYEIEYGATITAQTAPTKEGYTFSGWSEIPKSMPANDVTITGTFKINKYKLTYKVDDKVYKEYEIEFGATITPETAPTKEGHTFSGWSTIPEKMPAHDVTVTGTFSKGAYKLTYKVDGEVYKTISYDYGATITPEPAPTKEGYTFSGWSWIPSKMPAEDVTITGSFTANKYKLTYKVDGEVYKEYEVEYGATITPESAPIKEGYEFSGWSEIPSTMPAKNVEVTGTFKQIDYNVEDTKYEISGEGTVTIKGGNQKGNVEISGTVVINGQTYNVTAIAEKAFEGNTQITSVTIPEGIASIGNNAFSGCVNLFVINIGKSVTYIGNKAFANVGTSSAARTRGENSFTVNCYAESVPQTAADAFENSPIATGTLLVNDNLIDAYKTTAPWNQFRKILGFQEAAGIGSISINNPNAHIYDMQGNRIDNLQKGVNIIRLEDGKTKKVVVK